MNKRSIITPTSKAKRTKVQSQLREFESLDLEHILYLCYELQLYSYVGYGATLSQTCRALRDVVPNTVTVALYRDISSLGYLRTIDHPSCREDRLIRADNMELYSILDESDRLPNKRMIQAWEVLNREKFVPNHFDLPDRIDQSKIWKAIHWGSTKFLTAKSYELEKIISSWRFAWVLSTSIEPAVASFLLERYESSFRAFAESSPDDAVQITARTPFNLRGFLSETDRKRLDVNYLQSLRGYEKLRVGIPALLDLGEIEIACRKLSELLELTPSLNLDELNYVVEDRALPFFKHAKKIGVYVALPYLNNTAIMQSQIKIVEWILEEGYTYPSEMYSDAIRRSISKDNVDLLSLLVSKCPESNLDGLEELVWTHLCYCGSKTMLDWVCETIGTNFASVNMMEKAMRNRRPLDFLQHEVWKEYRFSEIIIAAAVLHCGYYYLRWISNLGFVIQYSTVQFYFPRPVSHGDRKEILLTLHWALSNGIRPSKRDWEFFIQTHGDPDVIATLLHFCDPGAYLPLTVCQILRRVPRKEWSLGPAPEPHLLSENATKLLIVYRHFDIGAYLGYTITLHQVCRKFAQVFPPRLSPRIYRDFFRYDYLRCITPRFDRLERALQAGNATLAKTVTVQEYYPHPLQWTTLALLGDSHLSNLSKKYMRNCFADSLFSGTMTEMQFNHLAPKFAASIFVPIHLEKMDFNTISWYVKLLDGQQADWGLEKEAFRRRDRRLLTLMSWEKREENSYAIHAVFYGQDALDEHTLEHGIPSTRQFSRLQEYANQSLIFSYIQKNPQLAEYYPGTFWHGSLNLLKWLYSIDPSKIDSSVFGRAISDCDIEKIEWILNLPHATAFKVHPSYCDLAASRGRVDILSLLHSRGFLDINLEAIVCRSNNHDTLTWFLEKRDRAVLKFYHHSIYEELSYDFIERLDIEIPCDPRGNPDYNPIQIRDFKKALLVSRKTNAPFKAGWITLHKFLELELIENACWILDNYKTFCIEISEGTWGRCIASRHFPTLLKKLLRVHDPSLHFPPYICAAIRDLAEIDIYGP